MEGSVRDVVHLGASTLVRVDLGSDRVLLLVQIANQVGPRSFKATPG